MKTVLLTALLFLFFSVTSFADPPFRDTTEIDIVNETNPTTFTNLVYEGRAERMMYDVRVVDEPEILNVFLFRTTYSDGLSAEFLVNPEFNSIEASSTQAEFYAYKLGQLPHALRVGVQIVWINMGAERFGMGEEGIWIHTGTGWYRKNNRIEEVLAHEAAHVSIGQIYAYDDAWLQAQTADGKYISLYGHDHPVTEDIAESFVAYMALRCEYCDISESILNIITETIPSRITYFDSLHLNMTPVAETQFIINAGLNDAWYNKATDGQGFFITVFPDKKRLSLAWFTYDTEQPSLNTTATVGAAGQRWLTALGPYDGDTANLKVYVTEGGLFDKGTPKPVTDEDGSMTLEFASCNEGLITYNIPSVGLSGTVPIERIADDNISLCETLKLQ